MHESSLVMNLLDQVRRLADLERAVHVASIEVEIGPLSGVEPLLIESAFERIAATRGFAGTRLTLLEVPLVAQCPQCDRTFEIVEFRFRCPSGCSANVRVIQGDGCILKRMTLTTDEQEAQV